jgi:hypothetical protein
MDLFLTVLTIVQSPIIVGVITWAVNLQGRVSILESKQVDNLALIDAKLAVVVAKLDAIDKRVERVETSLARR